ncbi:MAG: 2-phosphosulfolactate phosphatase, partial [Catenulispora sp.]
LATLGREASSPEAEAAVAAFEVVRARLPEALSSCASGRELIAGGFGADVAMAAAYDVSRVVPRLDSEGFADAADQDK